MRLGFTGTREGTSDAQFRALAHLVDSLRPTEAHHGCCCGADYEFAYYVRRSGGHDGCRVVGHPSTLWGMTDKDAVEACHEVYPAKPPLDRNHDIVDACDVLIACPFSKQEQQRSGTWATIRYARKAGKSDLSGV